MISCRAGRPPTATSGVRCSGASSALLSLARAAAVPALVYDGACRAAPVLTYEAGRVVPAGDVEALAQAIGELLRDPAALERAREGARRARAELTWDRSAAAHLELYRELV